CLLYTFFFQAEDGIRDRNVTGVQTCAFRSRNPWHRRSGWTARHGIKPSSSSLSMGSLLGASRAIVKGARRIPKSEGGSRPMKIRQLHDRLLVERLEEKEVKKGGIIIPDTAKEKPQEGKVIAVGNGKVTDEGKKIPLDVKAGDKILFGKYSGSEVKIDDKEYLIMREDDVLAILE